MTQLPYKTPPGFEDAVFDFAEATAPQRYYMVASSPRSGGTLLCRHLWASGIMGAPAEYFGFYSTFLRLVARIKPDTQDDYLAGLLALRTSANGVFGFKAHYDHLQYMMLTGTIHRFKQLRVISIVRQDLLAQAVSQARAFQTGQWNSLNQTPKAAPAYNADLIRWCAKHLGDQRRGWQSFFEQHKITPIEVDYDALAADPEGITNDVIARIDPPRSPVSSVEMPTLERQGDTINAEWLARFKDEGGAA
jgi:LPS sulfotransferase NodH